jgi:hypothetical protein
MPLPVSQILKPHRIDVGQGNQARVRRAAEPLNAGRVRPQSRGGARATAASLSLSSCALIARVAQRLKWLAGFVPICCGADQE